MLFDIYNMQKQVNVLAWNTHRTGTAGSHLLYSSRGQRWIHSTRDYAYKISIYIKHLAAMGVWIAWNTR